MGNPQLVALLVVSIAVSPANARSIVPASPGQTCGFTGNSDVYGLGIRCGLYIQAFATAVSAAYSQKFSREISFANGFFEYAMLACLVHMTWANDDLEVVEAMIVTVFTFCPVSISNPDDIAFKDLDPFSIKKMGPRKWLRHSLMPTLKMLADLVRAIYIAWFWFVGIDRQKLSPCTGYTFFFAKVSVFGWFHTLARIIGIGLVVAQLIQLADMISKPLSDRLQPIKSLLALQLPEDKPTRRLLLSLMKVGYFILGVELVIYWNSIQGVNTVRGSVGQTIPFAVGIGSSIDVFLDWDPSAYVRRSRGGGDNDLAEVSQGGGVEKGEKGGASGGGGPREVSPGLV